MGETCIKFEYPLVDERFIYYAIRGARLSKRSVHKMDSKLEWVSYPDGPQFKLAMGVEDERFCRMLLGEGPGADKFLRTIPFSVFITAPMRYFWDQDTYRVPPSIEDISLAETAIKQSSSSMHRFRGSGPFTADDFTPTTDPRIIAIANEKYDAWVAAGAKATSDSREWLEYQDAMGKGYLFTAHWYSNYAILRNLYFQRRHHRQHEFREMCRLIESLPYASLLITLEK